MATISVEYVNPFLIAATKVIKEACYVSDLQVKKPGRVEHLRFPEDTYTIELGIVGEMNGKFVISLRPDVALDIASKMCMMQLPAMDEMSLSAIGELGNMIAGNAATVYSAQGIGIDITPPVLKTGQAGSIDFSNCINIPLEYETSKNVELYVAVTD